MNGEISYFSPPITDRRANVWKNRQPEEAQERHGPTFVIIVSKGSMRIGRTADACSVNKACMLVHQRGDDEFPHPRPGWCMDRDSPPSFWPQMCSIPFPQRPAESHLLPKRAFGRPDVGEMGRDNDKQSLAAAAARPGREWK